MSLCFFDMDLTLTRVISAVFLGEELGKEAEVERLERLVATGEITDETFTRGLGELAKG